MDTYYKIRRQGNQLHVYVTVDGICIAHRTFLGEGFRDAARIYGYLTGLESLGIIGA